MLPTQKIKKFLLLSILTALVGSVFGSMNIATASFSSWMNDAISGKEDNISFVKYAGELPSLEEVEEVNIMTGITDILIKVRIKDIDQLNTFVIDKLRNIEGIDKTQTMLVLSEV